MNRIESLFNEVRDKGKTALMPFIMAGDPNIEVSLDLILEIEKGGADVIEVGVPFSDPMADGPTIQAAGQRALSSGTSLKHVLEMVKRVRSKSEVPLVLMSYYNLFYQYGLKRFAFDSAAAGADGVIIPDLPPEEAGPWCRNAKDAGIYPVFLIAPTTPPDRIKKADRLSRGFLYYVSITGVTGARKTLPEGLVRSLDETRSNIHNPLAVGFGISNKDQVRALSSHVDGIIVGSALVKIIERHQTTSRLLEETGGFIRELKAGIDNNQLNKKPPHK
nr:tryptophan synthase subunit alpha [Desulfobacterales bacterium]